MGSGPPDEHNVRVKRTLVVIAVLTGASLYLVDGDLHPPHGNPLIYAMAVSWLIALTFAVVSSAIFKSQSPRVFSLARWEKDGDIYDRGGLQAFRRILLHSPFGWINPNMRLSGRTDCDRLLREMNAAEGVHWLAGLVSVALAIWSCVDDLAAYGYSLLLVNIPVNLYPIVLQRWNRGRVVRLSRRAQSSGSIQSA